LSLSRETLVQNEVQKFDDQDDLREIHRRAALVVNDDNEDGALAPYLRSLGAGRGQWRR
jgi:hypothetical protein